MQPGAQIWWWRQLSRGIDIPYRGEILAIGKSRITVSVVDPSADNAKVVRHVTRERLHAVGSFCVKVTNERHGPYSPLYEWGNFTSFVEAADDLRSNRSVSLFDDGRMLRYDRTHWCDEFGMLGDARLNRNMRISLSGEISEISRAEFDAQWERAGAGALWQHQLSTSRSKELGDTPVWLCMPRTWKPPPLR